ncbi:protein TIF31 [Cryptococcus gattii Ru294]|nr:protein TIF31 [Cryptococcus gattii Ru294]
MSESAQAAAQNGQAEEQQLQQQLDEQQQLEEQQQLPPVTIRIPSPTCARTVPRPKDSTEPLDSITLYPQPQETIQDIKLLINDWVGAYWLGPYSLQLPFVKGEDGRGKIYSKKKDFSEVRAGEKLNEWLEVQDAFEHLQEGEERVLEAVREPYGELSARQSIIRLLELIAPSGTTANTTSNPLGLQAGSTIFEQVRDGVISANAETTYEEVEVSLPSGRKGKGGKKELVKVKRAVSGDKAHAFADWKEWAPASFGSLAVASDPVEVAPSLKSIQISPFNPPPPHLRQKGHELYLQVSLLEGEVVTLICSTRGWYVSKSNVNNFDPSPRPSADGSIPAPTHSLIDLLHSISPLFSERVSKLPPISLDGALADPISTVAIPQAIPAYPFLASAPNPAVSPEILRTQLAFLHTGAYGPDLVDAARDWNEEIQGIRELPRGTMQERVFREKMLQKVWAEFDQAAARAVQAVSKGDIPPINPAEDPKAHMYLQSNIFITQGDSDALDTYAHLGGDAAMRISHGKDAAGVKLLNKIDADGLYLLGHTIVDWQGRRWICQSILPGIFSNRRAVEEEKAQAETEAETETVDAVEGEQKKEDWVDVEKPTEKSGSETESDNPMMIYGLDSERPTSIHWDATTHTLLSTIATPLRLAAHSIKDGEGKEHEFYASAEVKGLKGQDGRRYLLDAQRLVPVDVEWLEKDITGQLVGPRKDNDSTEEGVEYPHRLVMLRPELIEQFWESELKRWARGVAEKAQAKKAEADAEAAVAADAEGEKKKEGEQTENPQEDQSPAASAAAAHRAQEDRPVDASLIGDIKQFNLSFNPDAFVEQPVPEAEGQKGKPEVKATITDESDPSVKAVRDAGLFLRQIAIPAVVLDVLTGNTSGVMDGESLSKHLHQRGVNIRYLGHLASTIIQFSTSKDGAAKEPSGHLAALQSIVLQEMVFRAAKHVLRELLCPLRSETATDAISHFLNCLLGSSLNPSPVASYTPIGINANEPEPAYVKLTPEGLRAQIIIEIKSRFRWTLDESFLESGLRKKQLLRELATRVGFQLAQREYIFSKDQEEEEKREEDVKSKEKKKGSKAGAKVQTVKRTTTFEGEDVLTLVPVIKSTAPSVSVAEEILEAGRNTINRGKIEFGLDFMLEAIQLYESIHSVIHPEVASVYNSYAQAIHQIARLKIQQIAAQENPDPEQPLGVDISGALRFQRQAVAIAERTLGVYHHETAGYYFQLAMLENLEGNAQQSLRYFRHLLTLWDVIYGPGHPEISTILSNAGIVLQSMNDLSLSLSLQKQAYESTLASFGPDHIQTGQSLHQLVQGHFLAGDMASALETAKQALEIFKARLGEEHSQTKEEAKNVELLTAVIENQERQKEREEAVKKEATERLKMARERIGGGATSTSRPTGIRRLGASAGALPQGVRVVDPKTLAALAAAAGQGGNPSANAAAATAGEGEQPNGESTEIPQIGERGTESLEELVRYIQGSAPGAGGSAKRGKNALRGKRRTGAKR